MKTINEDPEAFIENGGWSFLDPDSSVSFCCDNCDCNYNDRLALQKKQRWHWTVIMEMLEFHPQTSKLEPPSTA